MNMHIVEQKRTNCLYSRHKNSWKNR